MKNKNSNFETLRQEMQVDINKVGKNFAEYLLSYFNMIDEMNSIVLNMHKEFLLKTGNIISEYVNKSENLRVEFINDVLKNNVNTKATSDLQ